jgi:hypothetical protein
MDGKGSSQISKARLLIALTVTCNSGFLAKPLKIVAKRAGSDLTTIDPREKEIAGACLVISPFDELMHCSPEVLADWNASSRLEQTPGELNGPASKINVFILESCHFSDGCTGRIKSDNRSVNCFRVKFVVWAPRNRRKL